MHLELWQMTVVELLFLTAANYQAEQCTLYLEASLKLGGRLSTIFKCRSTPPFIDSMLNISMSFLTAQKISEFLL